MTKNSKWMVRESDLSASENVEVEAHTAREAAEEFIRRKRIHRNIRKKRIAWAFLHNWPGHFVLPFATLFGWDWPERFHNWTADFYPEGPDHEGGAEGQS